jgi:uncharacterized membrane protein
LSSRTVAAASTVAAAAALVVTAAAFVAVGRDVYVGVACISGFCRSLSSLLIFTAVSSRHAMYYLSHIMQYY